MSKDKQIKREDLLTEFHKASEIYDAAKKKLDDFDYKAGEKERNKMIGSCYIVKANEGDKNHYGYLRIEAIRSNYAIGTKVHIKKYKTQEGGLQISVELNQLEPLDWVRTGGKISTKKFNETLKKALNAIKI